MAIDTPEPSPFSHEILNANPYAYLDDAPLEERRARAVQMRRTLPEDYAEGAGALDAEAIAQVAAEAWPPMRDADELHEALLGFGVMPEDEGGTYRSLTVAAPFQASGESAGSEPRPLGSGSFFGELVADRRATSLRIGERVFMVAAERVDLVRQVYPEGVLDPPLTAPAGGRAIPETQERCAAEILRGWFECSGPKRASDFVRDLALPRGLVDQALAQLEAEGQILRGKFTPGAADLEWCHRRLLARIHRLTIGRLRREIEPVSTAAFYAFLNRWQHLAPGTQLHGTDGTLAIIRQLQGCEFAAAAWETVILPRRVARYQPEYLDELCLARAK